MNAISNQITNSTIAKWFNALSSREKKLVSWTGVALVALFLLGYALPSTLDYRHSNVTKLKVSSADLSWMKAYESTARSSSQQGQGTSNGGSVELSTISRSADLHDVDLQRIQPVSDGINIEITRQQFDSVLKWLFSLQNDEGVTISQARIMRQGSGLVDARVVVR
ncbi:MAG: type II secretion system protein M [Gammaproteobacteria bacterium]|nr:type II secretion system protein M [Gammaproteobacteria bacterium]MYD81329.1 type II secretion system protein M [Gammaproteobacteria bacterium]